jgi:hypothetical protein
MNRFFLFLGHFFISSLVYSQFSIGTVTPEVSSILDINSSIKGILIPRLSTLERNTINSPATGLVLYNTTEKCLEFFNGLSWIKTTSNIYSTDGALGANRTIAQGNFNLNFTGTGGKTTFTSGNVGIGTLDPTERLEVNGNIRANSVILNSDLNLKKNIVPLSNVFKDLGNINTYSYYFKKDVDSQDLQFGLIAQEVQKIYPNLVSNNGQNLGVNYVQLIPVLIQAVKELKEEIEILKNSNH